MFRWLKEFFNRAEKCKRVGHKVTTEKHYIFKDDTNWVAVSGYADFDICSCCGEILSEPKNFEQDDYWTGLSWPSTQMRLFRKQGWIIDDK